MSGSDARLDDVDILMLCRPNTRPPQRVVEAIEKQRGVRSHLHIGIGTPLPGDQDRWQTIARARNALKSRGSAPWAMFVDDDVYLDVNCVRELIDALAHSPTLGAIAADSAGEQLHPRWSGHVGMAACLFRRSVLKHLEFRSTQHACECWCCCNDLRRSGIGITYCANARAIHLRATEKTPPPSPSPSPRCENENDHRNDRAVVLAAFDRRDIGRFEHQFLHSLRTWGNREQVIAVAYGLYPSELARLRRLPRVDVVARPANGVMAPVRRLTEFAAVTRRLSTEVPIAYWDVADCIFQSSLAPLWSEVARQPGKLLAVVEPKSYPENKIIPAWALSIDDPDHRHRAMHLLRHNGFLNSGFAAGTAAAMHVYFDAAQRMRAGPELRGTSDWGDQMCLNVYCHSHPERWQPIHEGWNYCVHDRPAGEVRVAADGIIYSRRVGKIPVAHGNARSLRQFSLLVRQGA